MENLVQEEKHTFCRYCNGVVYASHPTCKKCGLEMSTQGVAELAEIESRNIKALEEIYKIKMTSVIFLPFTLIGFVFASMLDMKFFFHVYFWMGIISVFFAFLGWNQKYSLIDFTAEDDEIIQKYKKEILILFFCNLIVGLGIYIFWYK